MKVEDVSGTGAHTDYGRSDVEHLMCLRLWSTYDEVVRWLRQQGDNDNELTPGEVQHMIDDFSRLRDSGVELTRDPEHLYRELKAQR